MENSTTIDVSGMKEHVSVIASELNDGTVTTIVTKCGTIVVTAPRITDRL